MYVIIKELRRWNNLNVYDFDGTIYHGDSSVDFYKYCLKKKPYLISCMPKQIKAFNDHYRKKIITKTEMKQIFYTYLQSIKNIDEMIEDFWRIHEKNIYPWYLEQKKTTDIIISASPEFLLKDVLARFDVNNLIASRVDKHTGKYTGLNCWGQEKVNRLHEEMGDVHIDRFYSDSESDKPLALLADRAYMVDKKGNVKLWKGLK